MLGLLTKDEIDELCKPIRSGAWQARRLKAMLGCEIKRRPDGLPIVTQHMLKRLENQQAPSTSKNEAGINWSRPA